MKKALILGISGSFFFAFTFVLNRSMNLGGGYWMWSAVLRYFFTLPILLIPLAFNRSILPVLSSIRENTGTWILWSTVGFGLFYAPLTAASIYAESWFTAAIWQFTIVAGVLLTPLFGKQIPIRNLLLSCIILAGIVLMQVPKMGENAGNQLAAALILVVIAAFSYPLGNRKMMQLCGNNLTTLQRVFGMTLCSIPFWFICGIQAFIQSGIPSRSQSFQSLCVALFSGVFATILFFQATNLVRHNQRQLAVIEATQSGEVIFTLLLGVLILKDPIPSPIAMLGILLIVFGMILNSIASR